jgi:hypothetical protein
VPPRARRGLRRAEQRGSPDRRALSSLPLPAWDDGRIRLACDVSNWLRPDAETSPERLFCHCYARGKGNAQLIPGWPYSFIAALEPGRTSWTLPLDAVRLGPADDATAVTAAQVRDVVTRIAAAGHWKDGDPDIVAVFDSGYDLTRLAWLLGGLPVEVAGRLRSDRVMYFPAPPREPGATGRPPRHGPALRLADPASWPDPAAVTVTQTTRYGTATATAWGRLHQRLTARAGWTRPKLRDPAAADRWTWLVIAAYAQLHLARPLAADTRLPWQQPCPPGRLTPARVRRGFRNIRQALPVPASAPKPARPGPGRPPGSKNRQPATRHDIGKTVKREEPKKKAQLTDRLNNKLRAWTK